jgi:hypothetical protein
VLAELPELPLLTATRQMTHRLPLESESPLEREMRLIRESGGDR